VNIGGDIAGLRAAASSMSGSVDEVTATGEAVSKRVDALVGDAGWSGDAAEEFKGAWEQDATAIVELSECVSMAAEALSTLADDLTAAQHQLDSAVSAAKDAGVPVQADGSVPAGTFDVDVVAAIGTYQTGLRSAQSAAEEARDTCTQKLGQITAEITGDGDLSLLNSADLSVLCTVLRGYYGVPNDLSERAETALNKFKAEYKNKRFERKHTSGAKAKAALTAELKDMRARRLTLSTKLESAEKIADKFKGGRLISASLADVAESLGVLQDGGKLSRLLDGLPGVDVVLGGLATYAQAKDDHEKGWSWMHAIAVDGGSNAAAIGTGLATDLIPYAGPFLAPVTSYGVGAYTYEAGHEGHWTEHIHEDGVLKGLGEGFADSGVATWDNDVVGMYHKVSDDVQHPGQAASSLWQGVKSLF
jgi:uncharacterized protein YukE